VTTPTDKETKKMGKIVISTNISLDGIVEDPDGQEGFAQGGWFGQFGGSDLEEWTKVAAKETLAADALLLGRRSDEWFATRWLPRSNPWADELNKMPKFVVSSTLGEAKWSNATILNGDVVSEVTNLKQRVSGEILVYASYQLVQTLIENDLVDELRLVIFPVVLGTGKRLLAETSDKKPLRLDTASTIGQGLTYVTYHVVHHN
jgi:dihydrofolate reductase